MFFYNTMSRFGKKYRRVHPKGCHCRVCGEKTTQRHYNLIRITVTGIIVMAICI